MKQLINILKIIVPVGIGVYLSWFFYTNLPDEDRKKIPEAFAQANYFWVFLSLVIAWISHFSRAYRWKYVVEEMGYKPKISSLYHSVMIGYLINLTIPRAGEVARPGFFSKKENIPFDKVLGTVVAERVIDLIMLLSIMGITTLMVGGDVVDKLTAKYDEVKPSEVIEKTLSFEPITDEDKEVYDITKGLKLIQGNISDEIKEGSIITQVGEELSLSNTTDFKKAIQNQNSENKIKIYYATAKSNTLYYILGGVMLIGGLLFFVVPKIKQLILEKIKGMWEGIKSIFTLKKKGLYILHTLLIWVCYLLMFWICAQALPSVSDIDLKTTLLCFVVGGIAIAATPGGIGLYPIFVTNALMLNGIARGDASSFAVLIWLTQTVFLVLFGLYSLFAINVKFSQKEIENGKG